MTNKKNCVAEKCELGKCLAIFKSSFTITTVAEFQGQKFNQASTIVYLKSENMFGLALLVVSSQENMDSFLEMTIFSSAARYSKGNTKRQLKFPSPVNDL